MIKLNDPSFPEAVTLNGTDLVLFQRGEDSLVGSLSLLKDFVKAAITFLSTQISDSTAIGRTILTAADAAAVRTAIDSPETSHTHTATQISDSTAVGQSLMTAATAAGARTAISAAEATHTHSATDLTAPSRSEAADAGATIATTDRNGQIILNPDTGNVDLTVGGLSGFAAGDTIRIINVGSNSVDFVADVDASFVGTPAAVASETFSTMVCVTSSGSVQTWMVS